MRSRGFHRMAIVLSVATGVLLVAARAGADVWDVGPPFGSSYLTDNSLIDTPNFLVHGTTQIHDLAALQTTETCPVAPCPDRDWYVVLTPPYTSHEVVIDAVTPFASWKVTGPSATMGPPALSRHDWGGGLLQQAEIIGGNVVPSGSASLRWETTAGSLLADYVAVAQVQPPACGAQCDANAQYTIRYYETTLVAPRFNNSGSQTTVLLLQNRFGGQPGLDTITGNINFYVGGGPGTVVQVPFTMLESSGYVLNTATVPGLAGEAGRITISHNGRHGQLAGKVTAVEPATGFTFDTPLLDMPH